MTLFDNRRDKAATYQFTITPRVKSVLDKIVEDGRYCVVTHGGNDEYQLHSNEFEVESYHFFILSVKKWK